MAIQQRYDLDLIPNTVPLVVKASQYDKTSRLLIFNIYKQGELFTIPSGATVTIRGTKKDMTGFEYSCSYADSTVTAVLEEQMTIFSGKYPVELRIAQGSSILGTANFIMEIEESPLKDDTVISETQLPLLEEALEASVQAQQSALEAQQSAQSVSALIPTNTGTNGQALTKNGNGAEWRDNVNSFNGRTGDVVPSANDYSAYQISFSNSQYDATNADDAIEEITMHKMSVTISSATSGTFVDGMSYKYDVTWSGMTSDYFGYVTDVTGYDVKNGLYVETNTDVVTLYFGTDASNASMTICVEKVVNA